MMAEPQQQSKTIQMYSTQRRTGEHNAGRRTSGSRRPIEAPYSQEAEEALLGAILINPDSFLVISSFLTADDFFFLRHSYVWQALARLEGRREQIDNVTLASELQAMGMLNEAGGHAFITGLITATPTSIHAETYARLVQRLAVRRRLMTAADEIKGLALDENLNLADVSIRAENALLSVTQTGLEPSDVGMNEAMNRLFDFVEKRYESDSAVFLPTGYRELDTLISGLERRKFHVVAGLTNMGKSLFLLSVGLQMARLGMRVFLISNEARMDDMTVRLAAIETAISSKKIRSGQMETGEWTRFTDAVGRLSKLPLRLDYVYPLTPSELRGKCARVQREYGLDVVIVDGLYKMKAPGVYDYNRTLELGYISEQMLELAQDFNVPVLVSHQASDNIRERQDKRPTMGDFAYCRKIGQDADLAIFLHRESVFNAASEFPNQMEVIVAKGRDNATGSVSLYFDKYVPRIVDAAYRQIDLGDV